MKLGLCCISEILGERGVRFQTMTRKSANANAAFKNIVAAKIRNNLEVLDKTLAHCVESGISHYRLSSSMFPLVGDPTLGLGLEFLEEIGVADKLRNIRARNKNITLASHPSHFTILPSLNPSTVSSAIFDLEMHAWMHDALDLPRDYSNPINIHVGISSYDPAAIRNNFKRAFEGLSEGVRNRLVLENDDKGFWNCGNLNEYFGDMFPLTFDNLHHEINEGNNNHQYWIDIYANKWTDRGFTPVFHWSEGGANGKARSHADYFSHVPEFIKLNKDIIFECEVKAKDKAVAKVLNFSVDK